MAQQFGKTWWGGQWLNSLSHIDYSNRLPRGSSYARNGKVTSIHVEGNSIKAKVIGSRPKPYDVGIIIPPFFEADVKKLISAIAKRPVLISKLLNRELDPEVLSIAEQCGLKVFPQQWSDLKMQCSCPDWAVPCKHLAAVIYKVSSEIDNNPFLAFSLHNVDLPAELKKRKIYIEEQAEANIPMLKDIFAGLGKKKKEAKPKSELKPTMVVAGEAHAPLNFARLAPLHEPLIQLLADAPVFYQNPGNFREKYGALLHKVVRNAQRIVQAKESFSSFFPLSNAKGQQKETHINHHTQLSIFIGYDKDLKIKDSEGVSYNLAEMVSFLWSLPPAHVQDYQPSVGAMKNSLALAINMLANGAVIPELVQLKNKAYAIRWLPALLSKDVKAMVENLQTSLPVGLLWFEDKAEIVNQTSLHLLSAWLDALIVVLAASRDDDTFINLFFNDSHYAFAKPGEQALPGAIKQWLARYYLAGGKFKPALVVEELSDERFQLTVNIHEVAKPLEKPVTLSEIILLKKYEASRFEILKLVTQLSSFVPGLDNYINSGGNQLLVMDTKAFAPVLMQAIPAIQLLDISILLPKSLQHILKPKASVRIKQKTKEGISFMRLDKLLDFDWQVAVGDTLMGEEEFQELLKRSEGLIKFKTGYIYVSPADLEKLHKHFTSAKELSPFEMLRAALGGEYQGARIALTDEVQKLITELTSQQEVSLPANLSATLRPYQHRGFSWMYRNAKIGFGSVLADDMGLGKTLQVIATLLKYKEEGALKEEKAMVIAPTGLLTNWQVEIGKFAPSLVVKLHHGTARSLDKKEEFDVLLTSYGIVRSDANFLKKQKWHVVITDEAQNIKNHEAAQSKAVKTIPANTFIAMSGTPVENRLSELWSIMDFSNRGFLGSLKDFRDDFAIPIQNQNDFAAAEKLKSITAPFMMRRMKSDKSIISDLPDKIEMDCYGTLTKDQASLYEKTLQKALEQIEGISSTDQKSLFVRQGLVLQMILALKQICNHPTQFLKNNVMDSTLSGKMELLFDKLESIVESNEKVLLFTQFTEMGNLLKHFIAQRFKEEPLFYHGGCSLKQRKEMVDTFQNNQADKIFILSLKAAGTGLNLTAASHVIHYDLWWNPAVETQATDRAYRIGQKNNVMVHRFITKGTFEERINEMIQTKKALANLTVATGENWIGNLSNKELKNIFELG